MKENHSIKLLLLFILLNSLKITLIYFYLADIKTEWYVARFVLTLGFFGSLWMVIFPFKKLTFIIYLLQFIFFFTHLSYFGFFKFYLNIFAYSYSLNEIFSTFKNGAIYFNWPMLYLLIDLPIFILLIFYQQLFGFFYKKNSKKVVLNYHKAKWFLFFFLFVLQQVIFYIDEPFVRKDDALPLSERDIVSCYGLLVHNIYHKIKAGGEDKKINAIQYGKPIKIKSPSKKNLMFIQVESLQSFVVSNSISNIEITPHLNRLISQKGYLHPFCFAFHLGGHSADADVSVINNIHPFKQAPLINLKTYDFTNSFARLLLKEDYKVKAFHNHLKKFFHREYAYQKMKFEHFYEYKEMGYKTPSFFSKEDIMYSYVLNKIKKEQKPYYYQIITMSTHFPFKSASESSSQKKYHFVKDELSRNYLQCIGEMDESLSLFIDNALEIDSNLLIFVYGDHIGGNLKDLIKPSLYLDDNLLEFVPLIVFASDSKLIDDLKEKEALKITVLSFHDIAPSALFYSGGSNILYPSFGINLFEPPNPLPQIMFDQFTYERFNLYQLIQMNGLKFGGR